jgi:hypothetical protein
MDVVAARPANTASPAHPTNPSAAATHSMGSANPTTHTKDGRIAPTAPTALIELIESTGLTGLTATDDHLGLTVRRKSSLRLRHRPTQQEPRRGMGDQTIIKRRPPPNRLGKRLHKMPTARPTNPEADETTQSPCHWCSPDKLCSRPSQFNQVKPFNPDKLCSPVKPVSPRGPSDLFR